MTPLLQIFSRARALLLSCVVAIIGVTTVPADAHAIDLTGTWTGTTVVDGGGGEYPNVIVLTSFGDFIYGTQVVNGTNCTIAGSLTGTSLYFVTICPDLSYTSQVNAETDGKSMSGTFEDSQLTTGTFLLEKSVQQLNPTTKNVDTPIVSVAGTTATIFLQKFSKVTTTKPQGRAVATALGAMSKASSGLSALYTVNIKGPTKKQIITKSRRLSVSKLKPGTYTVTYKVSAVRGTSTTAAFTTKKSPVATFTIN